MSSSILKKGASAPFFVLYKDIRPYNKSVLYCTQPDKGGYYRKYWVIHDTQQVVFTINLV